VAINIRRDYGHADTPGQLLEKLNRVESIQVDPFIVQIANHLISINVKQDENHWWSPEMTLRIEKDERGSRVFEVIGPNPSMFTLAMFFVILGSVGFIASILWALSQMSVGDSSLFAWGANFASGVVIVATFGVLAIGRIKAADQVSSLRQFISDILKP